MKKLIYIFLLCIFFAVGSFNSAALERVDSDLYTPSDIKAAETESEELTLSRVTGLKAKSWKNTVTLTWNSMDEAYAYKVYVSENGRKYKYLTTLKDTEKVLTDLKEDVIYKFSVRPLAYDRGRAVLGRYSKAVTALTSPETVKVIKTRSITENSITVYWNEAKNATHYQIWVYDRAEKKYVKNKTVTSLSTTIEGLEKNTLYKIKIRTVRRQGSGSAYGISTDAYSEKTFKKGSPETKAQAAQLYNNLINAVKKKTDLTVDYQKSVSTEFYDCSRDSLESTVINTLRLFDGTLKKTYNFVGGTAENKTVKRLFEPYNKNAALTKHEIKSYSYKKGKDGIITFKIVLKGGEKNSATKYKNVISVPELQRLRTKPITVKSADIYYGDAVIYLKLTDSEPSYISYYTSALLCADFRVSKVSGSATLGYEMKESYKIK